MEKLRTRGRKEVGSEDGECGMKGWMDDTKEDKNAK